MVTELKRMQQRRDTAANWAADNPVLLSGELGLDTTNMVFRIGNGTDHWLDLPDVDVGGGTPDATTSVKGKVELATNAETATGTDTVRATTPAGVAAAIAAHPSGATALSGLTDVTYGTPVDGQPLTYDSTSGTFKPRNTLAGPKALRGLIPAFTRAHLPNGVSDGSFKQALTRLRHTAIGTVNTVQLVYVNWAVTDGLNQLRQITVKAGFSDPYDQGVVPVTFNGQRTAIIDPGGMVISDPITVDLLPSAGFRYWRSHTLVTVATVGDRWPVLTWGGASAGAQTDDSYEYGNSLTDKTLTPGAFGTAGVTGACGYGPAAIVGDVAGRRAVVFGKGDSIVAGTGDNGSGSGGSTGYLGRALATAEVAHILCGVPSDPAVNAFVNVGSAAHAYISNGWPQFFSNQFMGGCSHIYAEHGVNDITVALGNKTLAQLKVILVDYWTQCANRNAKVIAPTLTPCTTSTDSWATTGNQTISTAVNNTSRTGYNDWLRDGAPIDSTTKAPLAIGASSGAIRAGQVGHPLFAWDEIADLAETARNSGIWRAGYTSDGVHPNATGAAALAAGVNLAHLTV